MTGSRVALAEAEAILNRATTEGVSASWRTRIYQLAEALFQSIHMQLSVGLYQAQEEVRGASLDGIDFPLNNRPWLMKQFADIYSLTNEEDRVRSDQDDCQMDKPGARRILSRSRWCGRPSVYYRSYALPNGSRFLGRLHIRRYPYRKSSERCDCLGEVCGCLERPALRNGVLGSRP